MAIASGHDQIGPNGAGEFDQNFRLILLLQYFGMGLDTVP